MDDEAKLDARREVLRDIVMGSGNVRRALETLDKRIAYT